MKICALMPMKGNSERVKNKNLKLFDSRPLYHVVINELIKSKYINNIVVNTDSEEIKNDIRQNFYQVQILDRPVDIIGDLVPMNSIINYDISKIDADIFIQTHSTNPLLLSETLDSAIDFYIKNSNIYDSVFSVTRLQTRLYWGSGMPINHQLDQLLRTQDLDPVFEENSCFYIFTKQSFRNANSRRIGMKPFLFEINKIEATDIDEIDDFIIAEQLYKTLRKNDF